VEQGAAVMIRDRAASKDGWFWGWYGWPDTGSGWRVDYPPRQGNPLPAMGFGQYCVNCHASARDDLTYSDLGNIRGEPGTFISFLSQNYYQIQTFGKDDAVPLTAAPPPPVRQLVDVHRRAIMSPPPEKRTRSPGQMFLSDLGMRALPASTTGLIPG